MSEVARGPARGRVRSALAWLFGSVAVAAPFVLPFLWIAAPADIEVVDVLNSAGFALVFALFGGVGILLTARRGDNPIGPLLALAGAVMAAGVLVGVYAEGSRSANPWMTWLSEWMPLVAIPLVPLILLIFPNGRVLSRRWRVIAWAAAAAGPIMGIGTAITPGEMEDSGVANPAGVEAVRGFGLVEEGGVGWLLLMAAFVGSAVSLVIRFRRSSGVERQQMNGLALAATLLGAGWLLVSAFWEVLGDAVYLIMIPTFAGLPVATALAILKYRLFDIDVVINRALVYTSLTAVLVGVYALGVLVFRTLLDPITPDNDVAVATSTLGVAALFGPARRRIQSFIDRRFYRSRYDAQQTLEAFATRLRDEVDLDALSRELLAVVSRTVHPRHASVWLASGAAR